MKTTGENLPSSAKVSNLPDVLPDKAPSVTMCVEVVESTTDG